MKKAVSIQAASKYYGKLQAVNELSFNIEQGDFFGLLGPNGAGKSTLIGMISGLVRPSSGKISVMGYNVISQYAMARKSLGLVPQEIAFDPFFKVREVLNLQLGYMGGSHRKNQGWIDELLAALDLEDKADKRIKTLSGGMKRRVLIAQALVHRPPVVILDEPTAGVDVELRQKLWQLIRNLHRQGHTIILTTHYLEEAEALCDKIAVINHGELLAIDSKASLMQKCAAKQLQVWVDDLQRATAHFELAPTKDSLLFAIDEQQTVAHIIQQLARHQLKIVDLQTQNPSLEEVFLKMVG